MCEPHVWEEDGHWTAHDPAAPGVWGIGATSREAEGDFHEALGELHAYPNEISEALPG